VRSEPIFPPTANELRHESAALAAIRSKLERHISGMESCRAQAGAGYNAIMDALTFEAVCYLALERVKELQYFIAQGSESRQ
jgi:hypothetical protein